MEVLRWLLLLLLWCCSVEGMQVTSTARQLPPLKPNMRQFKQEEQACACCGKFGQMLDGCPATSAQPPACKFRHVEDHGEASGNGALFTWDCKEGATGTECPASEVVPDNCELTMTNAMNSRAGHDMPTFVDPAKHMPPTKPKDWPTDVPYSQEEWLKLSPGDMAKMFQPTTTPATNTTATEASAADSKISKFYDPTKDMAIHTDTDGVLYGFDAKTGDSGSLVPGVKATTQNASESVQNVADALDLAAGAPVTPALSKFVDAEMASKSFNLASDPSPDNMAKSNADAVKFLNPTLDATIPYKAAKEAAVQAHAEWAPLMKAQADAMVKDIPNLPLGNQFPLPYQIFGDYYRSPYKEENKTTFHGRSQEEYERAWK